MTCKIKSVFSTLACTIGCVLLARTCICKSATLCNISSCCQTSSITFCVVAVSHCCAVLCCAVLWRACGMEEAELHQVSVRLNPCSGHDTASIPHKFQVFIDSIPSDEKLLFWVKASDSGFGGFYSYITKNLCLSCVPFSFPCFCLNVFNLPCVHSEYVENCSRIILATEDSLMIGTLAASGKIERLDINSWKRVKYIGTKMNYAKKKSGEIKNPLSCSSSSDILIYTQRADEKLFRGVSLDYVPDRENCLKALRKIQKNYLPKAVRDRNSELSALSAQSNNDDSMRGSQTRSVSFCDDP